MTAPNTPTPDEQARIDAKSVADEFRSDVQAIVERIAAEYVAGKHSTLEEGLQAALFKQAAAIIAKLTAERDEWMKQAGRMQVHLTDEYERAEASEKRIKELEAEIKQLHEAEWDHQ